MLLKNLDIMEQQLLNYDNHTNTQSVIKSLRIVRTSNGKTIKGITLPPREFLNAKSEQNELEQKTHHRQFKPMTYSPRSRLPTIPEEFAKETKSQPQLEQKRPGRRRSP